MDGTRFTDAWTVCRINSRGTNSRRTIRMFPIALTLMKAGASVGPLVAYLSGWLTLALFRAPLEIGMLGWKLFAVRYICTLLVPPTAGLIAQMLFSNVNLSEM